MLSWLTWRIGAVALIILVGFGLAYFAPTAPEAPEDAIADCRSLAPPVLNPGENGVAMGLTVLATGETLPQLIRTMSVQTPAGDEAESDTVARLLARSPADLRDRPGNIVGRNLYRGDLEALLTTKPSGVFDSTTAGRILLDVQTQPTIRLEADQVVVTVPQPANTLLSSYSASEGERSWPAAPWQARFNGRDVTLFTAGRLRPGATWHVTACVEGMQILAIRPEPVSRDSRIVTWHIAGPDANAADPGITESTIEIELRPELPTALRMFLLTGLGRYASWSWIYLGPALLLWVGLILVPRTGNESRLVLSARGRFAAATLAVLRLALTGGIALLLAVRLDNGNRVPTPGIILAMIAAAIFLTWLDIRWSPGAVSLSRFERLAPGLAWVIAIAWVLAYVELSRRSTLLPDVGPDETWDTFRRVVPVIGYAGLLGTGVWYWHDRVSGLPGLRTRIVLTANFLLGLVICTPAPEALASLIPIWVTFNVAVGISLLMLALLPAEARRWIPTKPDRGLWVAGGAIVFAVLVVIQWGWATYQNLSLWRRAPIERYPITLFSELMVGLQGALESYAIAFLGPVSLVVPLLSLAAVVGVLRAAGIRDQSPLWDATNPWVGRLVIFLVLVFVVGYGGDLFGFRLPLALFIAIPLLQVGLTDQIARVTAWVDRQNGGVSGATPLLVSRRRELLDRAQALIGLKSRYASAHATYQNAATGDTIATSASGTVDTATATTATDKATADDGLAARFANYNESMAQLETEKNRLSQGTGLNGSGGGGTMLLPSHVGPGQLALALGPGRRWWDRGLLGLRYGSWIAWLPLIFFAYIVITTESQFLVEMPVPFALMSVVSTLANEVAFWLVASFSFGCLYPYLLGGNGLIKGAVLGGVYVLAHAGASFLGATADTLWQVRAVQLLLFLMLTGVIMDGATVEGEGVSWRYLLDRYQVTEFRTSIVYAALVFGALIKIGEQVASGEASRAVLNFSVSQQQVSELISIILGLT